MTDNKKSSVKNIMENEEPVKEVFVAMPFDPAFVSVYEHLIKPSCEELGLKTWRADEEPAVETIENMVAAMKRCKFYIADITGYNPNVMYEIGYLNALDKRGILITQFKHEILPVDISRFFIQEYFPGPVELKKMKQTLIKVLKQEMAEGRL